jgi:hypothetical protein
MNDDLPDDSPPLCCPSCGKAIVDHLGLIGTCAALAEARATIESMPLHFLGWLGVDPDDACPRCQGIGRRGYGSTSTWRGGVGGQAMTVGVCDQCWGSGSIDPWPSPRVRAVEVQQLRAALATYQTTEAEVSARLDAIAAPAVIRTRLRGASTLAGLDALGMALCMADAAEVATECLGETMQEADTLRAALAEVLGWMAYSDYPSGDRRQSRWVPAARVEELRRLVGVKP